MLTAQDLIRVVLVPVIVSSLIALLGRWRNWRWAMPLAAGAGFLTGYALLGRPGFPPRDGTDWLFWAAMPLIVLAILDAIVLPKWGWLLGASAGAVAFVILRPLLPGGIAWGGLWTIALVLAAAGAVLVGIIGFAEMWISTWAVVGALCIITGGVAVVVLSSNLRIVGVYGIAASAALGPIAVLSRRLPTARSVAIFSIPLLAGLLAGGHYYPEPGVSWINFAILLITPALLLIGVIIPIKHKWIRSVVAVLSIAIAVGAVTTPTALAAKKAAEGNDPYTDAAYK